MMMSFWSLHVNSFIHFPLTGISYTKRLVGRRWELGLSPLGFLRAAADATTSTALRTRCLWAPRSPASVPGAQLSLVGPQTWCQFHCHRRPAALPGAHDTEWRRCIGQVGRAGGPIHGWGKKGCGGGWSWVRGPYLFHQSGLALQQHRHEGLLEQVHRARIEHPAPQGVCYQIAVGNTGSMNLKHRGVQGPSRPEHSQTMVCFTSHPQFRFSFSRT